MLTRVCAAGWKVGAIDAPGSTSEGGAGRGGGADVLAAVEGAAAAGETAAGAAGGPTVRSCA